jgi:hypothetical protein
MSNKKFDVRKHVHRFQQKFVRRKVTMQEAKDCRQ